MSKIVGLTGQSGAGKTTVSDVFKAHGFGIINCDITARKVTEDGSECNRRLTEYFPGCFDKAFKLDRQALAREVFSDKCKLEKLDSIIYPYITELIKAEINVLSKKHQYILLDAPTLFEAGADKLCDFTVAVSANEEIRLKRILSRDGISEELIRKRFASQHSADYFKERCDFIIYNNGSVADAQSETERIINIIKET